MNKTILLFAALLIASSCKSEGKLDSPLAGKASLTAAETQEYAQFLGDRWRDSVKVALQGSFDAMELVRGDYRMPMDWRIFGDTPADGRSLYISLHGGGGAPAATNDQQWKNQIRLYQPAEGVYLCPRAIENTWDLHFRPESDAFYEEIIHMAVAHLGVNPVNVFHCGHM